MLGYGTLPGIGIVPGVEVTGNELGGDGTPPTGLLGFGAPQDGTLPLPLDVGLLG